MNFQEIEVESYSGYKINESPKSFFYNNKKHKIIEIIDRWYEGGVFTRSPILNYFKVKTEEEKIFILRYNELFDRWSLMIPSH